MQIAVVRILLTLVSFLVPLAGHAQVVRTWVASNGVDSNPCSRQLPCRNFAAAITAVSPGGEVVALDSAGYGAVVITKSVAIIAPRGVHASIAPTGGVAISVQAVDQVVTLRGLYLNGQGAHTGVHLVNHGDLYLDRMVLHGFGNGMAYDAPTGSTEVFARVTDTIARRNTDSAFLFRGSPTTGSGATEASMDRVQVVDNFSGVTSHMNNHTRISNSTFSGNSDAIYTTTFINVENCVVTQNLNGISVQFPGVGRVSNTTVSQNDDGIYYSNGAALLSFQNNRVSGNNVDGTFSGTIPLR